MQETPNTPVVGSVVLEKHVIADTSLAKAIGFDPINPLEQLVDGPALLEMLWPANSRPTMEWLRTQVECRQIPYIKRGRKTFYHPKTVMAWYLAKQTHPIGWKPAA